MLEDIIHLIADSYIMMICNCKKGYWHQELDEISSSLTTFNTELVRFIYTVMPISITVVVDKTRSLTTLLDTARKNNVHLDYDKLQYNKVEVDFLGETYMTSGLKPAQTKVSVITSMPEPNCKKQVQLFIGMVNYFSKFSTRLSELAETSQRACKRQGIIQLAPRTPRSIQLDKKETAALILVSYNPRKQMILQTDASSKVCVHVHYKRVSRYTL